MIVVSIVYIYCVFFEQNVKASGTNLEVDYLRCEYRVEPLGIDIANPRLSWVLESDQRGQKQSAYQVFVASSLEKLQKNHIDLWDSGKVISDETISVRYEGVNLISDQECFWKVKVWDINGIDCGWSNTAKWSMGLLNPSDWQAQWVGYDPPEAFQSIPQVILQARWIWADSNAESGTAVADRYFRREFEIPGSWQIKTAVCYITADDSFELSVNGQDAISGSSHSWLRKVDVAGKLQKGKNVFAVRGTNKGTSYNPAGLIFGVEIQSVSGDTMTIVSDGNWKAYYQGHDGWKDIDFDGYQWFNAFAFGRYGDSPWGSPALQHLPPARYLRKECSVGAKEIKKASLYVSALGNYEIFVNGQRVSDDYFSPGWTDYSKRVYYRTYDITERLHSGSNAIGAILADGWYAGYVGYARQRNLYGEKIRLLCQLNIEYVDGTTQ
ncbi:MAG: alpha-L-rhamnosidase N-terminal domain-containing protein, partial [Desulfobacterales bacterium]|nr:alpha-L-rhamnosidase N-terminal domain-containing protein [Desulfobacterales bacterium]